MKQILVGLGALVLFVAYSLGIRHEQAAVIKPVAIVTPPTATGTLGGGNSAGSETINPGGLNGSTPGSSRQSSSGYKNGTYTGSVEDAFYGNVQVSVKVSAGKLTDVTFLQYPNSHSDSVMINQQAMPMLQQEAIQKQSAHVDIISGATFTSQAFIQSLTNALNQAS